MQPTIPSLYQAQVTLSTHGQVTEQPYTAAQQLRRKYPGTFPRNGRELEAYREGIVNGLMGYGRQILPVSPFISYEAEQVVRDRANAFGRRKDVSSFLLPIDQPDLLTYCASIPAEHDCALTRYQDNDVPTAHVSGANLDYFVHGNAEYAGEEGVDVTSHTVPMGLGVSIKEAEDFYRSSFQYKSTQSSSSLLGHVERIATASPSSPVPSQRKHRPGTYIPPSSCTDDPRSCEQLTTYLHHSFNGASTSFLPSRLRVATPYTSATLPGRRFPSQYYSSDPPTSHRRHSASCSPHATRHIAPARRPPPRLPNDYRSETPFSFDRLPTPSPFNGPGETSDPWYKGPRVPGVVLEREALQRASQPYNSLHRATWFEDRAEIVDEVSAMVRRLNGQIGHVRDDIVEEDVQDQKEGFSNMNVEAARQVIRNEEKKKEKFERFKKLRRKKFSSAPLASPLMTLLPPQAGQGSSVLRNELAQFIQRPTMKRAPAMTYPLHKNNLKVLSPLRKQQRQPNVATAARHVNEKQKLHIDLPPSAPQKAEKRKWWSFKGMSKEKA